MHVKISLSVCLKGSTALVIKMENYLNIIWNWLFFQSGVLFKSSSSELSGLHYLSVFILHVLRNDKAFA